MTHKIKVEIEYVNEHGIHTRNDEFTSEEDAKSWITDNLENLKNLNVILEDNVIQETCVCKKCGNSLICRYLHNDGESHQESLCANCI